MKKIVFVIPDMPGGGTERVVALLANEYSRQGREVAILLFAGRTLAYPLDEKIEVASVGEPSGGSLRSRMERIRRMRDYYRRNRDCRIWSFSVMGAVFSVAATVGMKHSMLISERNDPNRYEHPYIRNFFYRFADVIVCQTEDAVRCFPKAIRKKSTVIPNPVDIGQIEPYEGVREKRVVAVGRLEPQKNHSLLLRAFSRFAGEHPEYILELYGQGEQRERLIGLAKELGIEEKVSFCGFSSRVREDIRKAAMFVLSSDYEGISNSMLEAMALGVPVIATDCPIGGSHTYIKDGVNGILVPVGEEEPMVRAMCRLAEDDGLGRRIGARAASLREQLRTERIAKRFLECAGEAEEINMSRKEETEK